MHVDRAVPRAGHHCFIADPVAVLLGHLHRFLGLAEQRFHAPALRVHDVGVREGIFHVVDDRELSPRARGIVARDLHGFVHERVLGRVCERDVHAETRHQHDQALWDRHGLHVAGCVGPRNGNLQVFQVFTELFTNRHEVCEGLAGVIDVALHVDDRDRRVLRDLAHVGLAFARHEIVANHDPMAIGGQNRAHILRALAVRDLRGFGINEMGMAAQLGHAGFERVARARGLVEENQERRLVREMQRGDTAPEFGLEVVSRIERELDLVVRPVLCHEPVAALHVTRNGFGFAGHCSSPVITLLRTRRQGRNKKPCCTRDARSRSVRSAHGRSARGPGRNRWTGCRACRPWRRRWC